MRIILATNAPSDFHVRLHAMLQPLGHSLLAILTCAGPRSRRAAACKRIAATPPPGVAVVCSNRRRHWPRLLRPYDCDILLCNGFSWKIPAEVLALPRLGALNVHNSELPRYRGPNAFGWALRNGDDHIGASIHRMDEQFDTGPLLTSGRFPIGVDDDFDTIVEPFLDLVLQLLPAALTKLECGDPGIPQDEAEASYAGPFEKAWRWIDWKASAARIHNQIRSWIGDHAEPRGALAWVDGERWRIEKSSFHVSESTAAPGSVVACGAEPIVQCGQGQLRILSHRVLTDEAEER